MFRVELLGGDAVDVQIEVRSSTVFGLVEVAVGDRLGVGSEVRIGIHIRLVRGQRLAADGEGGGVKDVQGAVLELLGGFRDLLGSALGSDLLVDIGQHDGAGLERAGPVGIDRQCGRTR